MYIQIRHYVETIEGSHNGIIATGLRNVKEFGDFDIISTYRELMQERKENEENLGTTQGYIDDVRLIGKLATLAGMVDVSMECANMIKTFRDHEDMLDLVLQDKKKAELHAALCANAYNN